MSEQRFVDKRFEKFLKQGGALTVGHREGTVTHVPRANDRKTIAYRCNRCRGEFYGGTKCPYPGCGGVAGESFVYTVRV